MKLNVNIDHTCTYSKRSKEAYGDWRSDYSNDLESVTISEDGYGEPIDFEVENGEEVFVVWAEYSTGDSFGRSSGSFDVVTVYKSEDKANKAAKILTSPVSDGKDYYESWTVELTTEGGSLLKYNRPWMGYFEHLEGVNVTPAIIGSGRKGRRYV